MAPQIQLKVWGVLLAPSSEKNDICSHHTRFMGSKDQIHQKMRLRPSRGPQTHFWVYLEFMQRVNDIQK